jgi:RNA 2',3'-cyclic 3'-phosphodiesterase
VSGRGRDHRGPDEPDPTDGPRRPRVFVAIPLPEPAVERVTSLVEAVRGAADPGARDVRWVRLDGLHLTLRFIGPIEEDRLPAVREAMDVVARGIAPFDVAIDGAGAFPSVGRPRALWLGVTRGDDRLAAAASALDDALAPIGLELSDRPYRAHLTLARADGVRAAPNVARRLVDAAAGLELQFMVTELVLFESVQGGGPARYVRLNAAPMSGDATPRDEDAPARTR